MIETEATGATTEHDGPSASKPLLIGGGLLVLLPILYFTGIFSSGYESKTISFSGACSRTEYGSSLGSKTVHLRKGQTFVVNYEAEIEKGDFTVRVKKAYVPIDAPEEDSAKLTRTGSGQLRIPARETAFYRLYAYGSPRGDGYAMSYTLSWGVE